MAKDQYIASLNENACVSFSFRMFELICEFCIFWARLGKCDSETRIELTSNSQRRSSLITQTRGANMNKIVAESLILCSIFICRPPIWCERWIGFGSESKWHRYGMRASFVFIAMLSMTIFFLLHFHSSEWSKSHLIKLSEHVETEFGWNELSVNDIFSVN